MSDAAGPHSVGGCAACGGRVRGHLTMTASADPAARVQELAAALTAHRAAYYAGTPKVSDFEYDQLEDELRTLLREHPDLAPDPNPLEQVGAPAVLHAPVRHDRPMLSLEKATTPEQVEAFMARFPGQRVVVMPKLDGLSLSIVWEGGRLLRVATRGDGTTGEDVTPIARAAVDGVPAKIAAAGRVEVRGEAVMLRSTFAGYNAAHPDKPLVNPRNGAAGTLRQKDPAKAAQRGLHFFAFDTHPPGATDLEDGLGRLGVGAPQEGHARPRRSGRTSRPCGAGAGGRGRRCSTPTPPRRRSRRSGRSRPPAATRTPISTARSCGSRARRRTRPPARGRTARAARSRSSTRPRRRRRSCATSCGTSARSARSRRSRCWSRSSSRAATSAARRSPTRRSSGRATCASATPCSSAAPET